MCRDGDGDGDGVMVMVIVFDTRERVCGGVFVSQLSSELPLSLSECFTGVCGVESSPGRSQSG